MGDSEKDGSKVAKRAVSKVEANRGEVNKGEAEWPKRRSATWRANKAEANRVAKKTAANGRRRLAVLGAEIDISAPSFFVFALLYSLH